MAWNVFFVFVFSASLGSSMENYYEPPRRSMWGYFAPPTLQRVPLQPRETPMEAMVDLTNNLGVAILREHFFSRGNFAFSPYGVASVLVVLYEGAKGESARQIHRAVKFPSDKDIIRIGFRDIHRHLRSYFSHEGYLSGISLNKENSSLKSEYKKILKFYGYDVDLNQTFDEEHEENFENTPSEVSLPTTSVPPRASNDSNSFIYNNSKSNTTLQHSEKGSTEEAELEKGSTEEAEIEKGSTEEAEIEKGSTEEAEIEKGSTEEAEIEKGSTEEAELEKGSTEEAELEKGSTEEAELEKGSTEEAEIEKGSAEKIEHTTITELSPTTTELQSKDATTIPVTLGFRRGVTEPPYTEEEIEKTLHTETVETTTESSTAKTELQIIEIQTTLTAKNSSKQNAKDWKKEEDNTKKGTEENKAISSMLAEGQEPYIQSSSDHLETESKTESTEKDKVEEITNVSIDNGMLIPQSDDLKTTTAVKSVMSTEAYLSIPDVTGPSLTETITEGVEGTTVFPTQKKNSLLEEENRIWKKNGTKLSKEAKGDKKFIKNIRDIVDTKLPLWLSEKKNKPVSRKKRTITDYLKSPHNLELNLHLQNGMYDTHISRNADLYRNLPRLSFLVDGIFDILVPMMSYTNVFPHAYIPRLHSKALKFPLDDIRYKLLILLPVERRGLRQLIHDLSDFPLRNVLECLRPARVKATIPTFMVEGFVILTSSLQKLGIWDVFDPRKANLSGMSMDPELYVRNVEQSVTVIIRNYVEILDIQTRTMAARHIDHEFDATHPFLYFVLDEVTNVSLMAGQILDPLNSRIY